MYTPRERSSSSVVKVAPSSDVNKILFTPPLFVPQPAAQLRAASLCGSSETSIKKHPSSSPRQVSLPQSSMAGKRENAGELRGTLGAIWAPIKHQAPDTRAGAGGAPLPPPPR